MTLLVGVASCEPAAIRDIRELNERRAKEAKPEQAPPFDLKTTITGADMSRRCADELRDRLSDTGAQPLRVCLALWPSGSGFDLVPPDSGCITADNRNRRGMPAHLFVPVFAPDGTLLQTIETLSDKPLRVAPVKNNGANAGISVVAQPGARTTAETLIWTFDKNTLRFVADASSLRSLTIDFDHEIGGACPRAR